MARNGDENLEIFVRQNAFSCFIILLVILLPTPMSPFSYKHTQNLLSDLCTKNFFVASFLPSKKEIYLFFLYMLIKYIFNVSSWGKKHAKMIFCLFSPLARHESAFSTKRSIFSSLFSSLISDDSDTFCAFASWKLLPPFFLPFDDGKKRAHKKILLCTDTC